MLYHLTNKESVPSILKTGLKPGNGKNCLAVAEPRFGVFLCSEQDIGKWAILLGLDALLCIKENAFDKDKLSEYEYECYSEWLYESEIPAGAIHEIPLPAPSDTDMRQLAMSVFLSVNRVVVDSVKFYERVKDLPPAEAKLAEAEYGAELKSVLACAKRIDFRSVPQKQYRARLVEEAEDGEYMMTDYYKNTGLRLYDLLTDYYKNPKLQTARPLAFNAHRSFPQDEDAVYALIMSKWTKVTRSVDTGGWTG